MRWVVHGVLFAALALGVFGHRGAGRATAVRMIRSRQLYVYWRQMLAGRAFQNVH
jgi:ABC-type methionine transport system ATPase subunit